MGQDFFPLDEELKLVPGGLTPMVQESMVRMGAWIPFKASVGLLKDLLRIEISVSEERRVTEAAGKAYVEVQRQEVERIEKEAPQSPQGVRKGMLSTDGAFVPLRHGEWAEVKSMVIGEVQPAVEEKGEQVVHTRDLSYFSRLATAEEFERLSLVEVYRRGIEHCQELAAVMDGADWEQGFVDYHYPQAVRILDFPHAAQRVGEIGEVVWGEKQSEKQQWVTQRLHQLKHEGPTNLLAEIHALHNQHANSEVLLTDLNYLEKRQSQMQYPLFQAQGWPIGSGSVESGNKLVVEARLKGAGMHWERQNVNPMLALRNIVCSDRWKTDWPLITQQLRRPAQPKQCRQKLPLASPSIPSLPQVASPQPLPSPSLSTPAPDTQNSSPPKKPAPNHPWRHSPIGKARFLPADNAKS